MSRSLSPQVVLDAQTSEAEPSKVSAVANPQISWPCCLIYRQLSNCLS
jgi:hypothetical protein